MLHGYLQKVFSLDIRSLAVFRIGLGFVLLWDLAERAFALTAHYTAEGILPIETLYDFHGFWGISLHLLNDSFAYQAVLFLIAGAFASMLLLGYRTQLASIMSWFMLFSLVNRNYYLQNGGDQALLLFLFWAMFLPMGAIWSMDARVKKPVAYGVYNMATVALTIQIVFIYLFNGLNKSAPDWMSEFSAVYYAVANTNTATLIGVWFWQFESMGQIITVATLVLEYLGTLLILSPWAFGPIRMSYLIMMSLFHTGIKLTIAVGIFSLVCIVGLSALTPSWFWDKIGQKKEPIVYQSWGLGRMAEAFIVTFLILITWLNLTTVTPLKLPAQLNAASQMFSVYQTWEMFAPAPLKDNEWFVLEAYPEEGAMFYVKGIDRTRPQYMDKYYWHPRWKNYLRNLTYNLQFVPSFANYYCKQFPDVERIEVYFLNRTTLPDYKFSELSTRKLGICDCKSGAYTTLDADE